MAVETICLLFDEVADHVAGCKPQPRWGIETRSEGRLYKVSVALGDDVVVDVASRDLGSAHRKALDAWRAWEANTESYLVEALETSIEARQAERTAGVSR